MIVYIKLSLIIQTKIPALYNRKMTWVFITLKWYLALLFIGTIFYPLVKRIFGKYFFDHGYPFAKPLAILFLSYAMFILGIFKILAFTQSSLILLIFGSIVLNTIIFFKKSQPIGENNINNKSFIYLVLFEELLFIVSLLFWTHVRGQEPSIRSLEKFMDFGFINSILRSHYFPPLDMWLSADPTHPNGYPINYYYFGHLTGALLIRLTGIKPAAGYNLILSSIFALSVTQVFSIIINIIYRFGDHLKSAAGAGMSLIKMIFFGLVGSFIVNLGGNLHTIYAFTSGYANDKPVPFWQIFSMYNPTKYWYPNATRFIPLTIHEFPSYSYVVADLHGHVFDIPFVLLTLAFLFLMLTKIKGKQSTLYFLPSIFLGFLTAVHYMTNAFDGPIYLLLTIIVFMIMYRFTKQFFIAVGILIACFIIFSLPFSAHFSPFITGIGVNCSPDYMSSIHKFGPFLFEKGNCQISPLWMLVVLWGFFWTNFILFLLIRPSNKITFNNQQLKIKYFIFLLFAFGTFLVLIPEFFYIKDIYPAHFRANTMFKLGYQAFIMMGIASSFVFFYIKNLIKLKKYLFTMIFIFVFFFVAIYPSFSIPSYYGDLKRQVILDGMFWLRDFSPSDLQIINYLNTNISGQPTILEAQGDSYTDFERISANTGLPTVAGWLVHEWLWRGSSEVVGKRIPDIVNIYESNNLILTRELLRKYHVQYVIVSKMEKQKYPKLNEEKFLTVGKLIFSASDGFGALYQVD